MHQYSLFGGCLKSGMQFTELPPSSGIVPRWTIQRSDAAAEPVSPPDLLGSATYLQCEVTLFRTRNGFRLRHACTADYDITTAGDITCFPRADVDIEHLQNDLTGRVMPVVLHTDGMLCLHGSGVTMGGRAIGFLAESGYGKSTLALALVRAGARLITDDTFAIDFVPQPVACPGVPHVRVRSDTSRQLSSHSFEGRGSFDGKHLFADFDAKRLMQERTPLGAIYVLAPTKPIGSERAVRRTLMPASQAAIAFVHHAKIGMLLGGTEAPVVLQRTASVARSTPVYTLHVPRDLRLIDTVVAQIAEWHATDELAVAC